MALRGAPSPGCRRPPISPAPSPPCPARLRRGALRRVRRTRGPAGRRLAIGPCLSLFGRPPDGGEPRFSLCPAGRAGVGPRRDPSLAKGGSASEPRASASWFLSGLIPDCHLLRLPPSSPVTAPAGASAALSARRVGAQPRRADLASDPAQRGESGSSAADPEPERGGERGRGRGGSGQWLGAELPPPLHHPRPPLPFQIRHGPRPRARPSPPRGGSLAGTTVSLVGTQPRPVPFLAESPPTQTIPGFFPISIAQDGRLSLHPGCPAALSADPRPQLLTPLWAKSCTALCPRPRPWRVDGHRGPGRRAERCAGPATRPVTAATPGVCSVRARSERRAPGEQVPVAGRAHERAAAVSDGRGGGGGVGSARHDSGPRRFPDWGGIPVPRSLPPAPQLVLRRSRPSLYQVQGGS